MLEIVRSEFEKAYVSMIVKLKEKNGEETIISLLGIVEDKILLFGLNKTKVSEN